ncbi:MAG: ABC transporter permease [bacterium]
MSESTDAPFRFERTETGSTLHVEGAWTAEHSRALHEATRALARRVGGVGGVGGVGEAPKDVRIDLQDLTALDATGAWLLCRLARDLVGEPGAISFVGTSEVQQRTLDLIERSSLEAEDEEEPPSPQPAPIRLLETLGRRVDEEWRAARRLLGFLGMMMMSLFRTSIRPWVFPWISLVHHMSQAGVRAFPIISLIGFLIGTVLAYQGVIQLSRFGADIFVVELVAISTFREVGILLTAIVVAGRSGSAFASEIGSMMLSDEIAAMRTMGLDPFCRLVAPRALALILMLPLLAVAADLAAIAGGALGTWTLSGLAPAVFLHRLQDSIGPTTLAVGLVKAPVFAVLIALSGCYQGFCVEEGAAELGMRTTRSVVQGIFLVIVMDALFSIYFAEMGI